MATQPDELFARLARDPRLDAFHAKNKQHLIKDFMWELLHQAEMDVLKDTRAKVKEMQIPLASGDRSVNMPDDFLEIDDLRYRLSSDAAAVEGFEIEIVDKTELL